MSRGQAPRLSTRLPVRPRPPGAIAARPPPAPPLTWRCRRWNVKAPLALTMAVATGMCLYGFARTELGWDLPAVRGGRAGRWRLWLL